MTERHHSGIFISAVRIRNFRCFRQAEVRLTPVTLIIGQNNAGKTSFLEALYAVAGAGMRHLTEEDIFIAEGEEGRPRDREVTVDLLIRPTDGAGAQCSTFEGGSPWLELWGSGVVQDDEDNDFVGVRMSMSWDRIKGEYIVERKFLREWSKTLAAASSSEISQHPASVASRHLLPLTLYMLDAKRDASEEMRTRGSIWNRLISDHGLSDETVAEIEAQLNLVNEMLVQGSPVLSHIQQHLIPVSGIVNCDTDGIAVNPVARRLRDLSKGMDVVLATKGAQRFSLSQQGMGTRSLASILVFSAYMKWQQQNQQSAALHPFVAIEEPETHLHPQAQRALFNHLSQLPGQIIVSTHSPYVCSQADISSFVHFLKEKDETLISCFYCPDDAPLDPEAARAINRRVMNTRGDLLFSRCVILFEGETEEQALPMFAERHWGVHPNELGISFISVDGCGNYLPFLRLTTRLRLPWVVFSDGEENAIKALNTALQTLGQPGLNSNDRCVVIPNAQCFEDYMVTIDSLTAIQEMIAKYKIELSGQTDERAIEGITRSWKSRTLEEVLAEIKSKKTTYGARLEAAFKPLPIPPQLTKLFDIAYCPGLSTVEGMPL